LLSFSAQVVIHKLKELRERQIEARAHKKKFGRSEFYTLPISRPLTHADLPRILKAEI
jgi:hypothetical protein